MKRSLLLTLLLVLTFSLFGVCQTTFTPIPNPTPALNSVAGEWNAGLCINTGFFNLIHFSFNTAAQTMSITANGYPGTKSFHDFSKDPFVYGFSDAFAYKGDVALTYTYVTVLPDDQTPGLGNKGDKLTTFTTVVPLSTNRYMAIYFRNNDTQDKELYRGTVFAYRSADYIVESLSDFATEGRDLCNAIYNLSTEEQGRVLRQWAKQ